MIVSPSILSADFLNLQSEIEAFNQLENISFHLDIMDGHYVPNLTFGKTVIKNLSKVTHHALDAHLMVRNPEAYIEDLSDIGLNNFTFHWEATTHHDSLIAELKKRYPSVGISLNPGTPESSIPSYLLEKIDLILIMSVNPGFGGQKFIDYSFEKIKYFTKLKQDLGLNFDIQVDGGVTDKNAKELRAAGATNLVAGSYIFGADKKEYSSRVESLR
tara:strand:- start:260083 stop:260730 length:648 start_codon:yes stop_codon:yes gene_type:complete